MSTPPHRDLPIEWRTETGEFIAQPVPDPPVPGPRTPDQPTQSAGGAAPPQEPPLSPEDHFEPTVDPHEHRLAVRLRVAVVVLALLGVAAIWATGGLETAPTKVDELPTVAVRESVETGPFRLAVERAAVFTEFGSAEPSEDGGQLLVVAVTAEVTADRTRSVSDAVSLSGVDGLAQVEPVRILLMRDSRLAFYLQPALPERVAYVWELTPGAAVPPEIDVLLNGATYRKTNFAFLNQWAWWDEGPRARVTVPVEDRRQAP